MEPRRWAFVLLKHKTINLNRLDSPKLALQGDTIFVDDVNVMTSKMSFDPPSWISQFSLKVKKRLRRRLIFSQATKL